MGIATAYDSIYGLAVGDALGVPYEKETFDAMQKNRYTGMIGFFHHNQPPGTWSDDTSMTLCTADSLCGGFEPDDMMKKFCQWRRKKYYTAGGKVFDVGRTCRKAMDLYQEGYPAERCGDLSVNGNGNGALMRIAPVVLYQYYLHPADDEHLADFLVPIHKASSLTHAHEIGLICCGMYAITIREILMHAKEGLPLEKIFMNAYDKALKTYRGDLAPRFKKQIDGDKLFSPPNEIAKKAAEELPQWGYALNTWNIAVWSILNTDNYRDCVIKAINLGGDTDSNAAVAGSMAGIIYGKSGIPKEWIEELQNKELIETICGKFTFTLERQETKTIHEKAHISQLNSKFKDISLKKPAKISIDGYTFNDMRSALYALNSPETYRRQFENTDTKNARKIYKSIPHDEETEELLRKNLRTVILARCTQENAFRQLLLETGDRAIIYDTSGSHDNILGRCSCRECKGKEYQNLYGKELTDVRELLKRDLQPAI